MRKESLCIVRLAKQAFANLCPGFLMKAGLSLLFAALLPLSANAVHKADASASVEGVEQASGFVVKGNVIDDTKEPLIGVSVMVEGTSIGTTTDFDGNYELKIPDGKKTLVFSYIGYSDQKIPVKGRNQIDVTMSEDEQVLAEVVVTAMGIERKAESLTYATPQVGRKE